MQKSTLNVARFGPIAISAELDKALRSSAHHNGHVDNSEEEWRQQGLRSDRAFTESEDEYLVIKKARMGL